MDRKTFYFLNHHGSEEAAGRELQEARIMKRQGHKAQLLIQFGDTYV